MDALSALLCHSSGTPLGSSGTPSISTSSCLPPASCLPHPRVISLLLFSEFQAAIANGAPLLAEVACCVIEDADARVAHADRQWDEAEARKFVVFESYDELNGKKVC
jgi:hypothetical protein